MRKKEVKGDSEISSNLEKKAKISSNLEKKAKMTWRTFIKSTVGRVVMAGVIAAIAIGSVWGITSRGLAKARDNALEDKAKIEEDLGKTEEDLGKAEEDLGKAEEELEALKNQKVFTPSAAQLETLKKYYTHNSVGTIGEYENYSVKEGKVFLVFAGKAGDKVTDTAIVMSFPKKADAYKTEDVMSWASDAYAGSEFESFSLAKVKDLQHSDEKASFATGVKNGLYNKFGSVAAQIQAGENTINAIIPNNENVYVSTRLSRISESGKYTGTITVLAIKDRGTENETIEIETLNDRITCNSTDKAAVGDLTLEKLNKYYELNVQKEAGKEVKEVEAE